jgi:hypothetical protein
VGSCIGHAGFPYELKKPGQPCTAKERWIEDQGRFGTLKVRDDRGCNGYCELVLRADGKIGLSYIDWMGRSRHQEQLARKPSGIVDFI